MIQRIMNIGVVILLIFILTACKSEIDKQSDTPFELTLNQTQVEIDLSKTDKIYFVSEDDMQILQYLGEWAGKRFFLLLLPQEDDGSGKYGQVGGYYAIGTAKTDEVGGEIMIIKELEDFGMVNWNGPNLMKGRIYLTNADGIIEFSSEGTNHVIVDGKEGLIQYQGTKDVFLYSYIVREDETHFVRRLEGYSLANGTTIIYQQFSYEYDDQTNLYTGEKLNTAAAVTEDGFCYAVSELHETNLADASAIPATVYYQSFSGAEAQAVLNLDHAVGSVYGDGQSLLTASAGGRRPVVCSFSLQENRVTRLDFPEDMTAAYFRSVTLEDSQYRFSNENGLYSLNIGENELTCYQLVNVPEGYVKSSAYWAYDEREAYIIEQKMKGMLFFSIE